MKHIKKISTYTSLFVLFLSFSCNILPIITGFKNGIAGAFKPVDDSLNLAQYSLVGTHNSHVYPRFFKNVIQHSTDISGQLDNGVRGFMIDVYNFNSDITNKRYGDGNIVLSHAEPGFTAFTQKGFTGFGIVEYQTYQFEMNNIVGFLKSWPSEIVFVHLEDHADTNQLDNDTAGISGINDVLFKPSDWNPEPNGAGKDQVWPTLGWMRKNNKRLIITSDKDNVNSKYMWPVSKYFAQNRYGFKLGNCYNNACVDYDPNTICSTQYASGPQVKLNIFNNFGSAAVTRALWDTKSDMLYDTVKNGLNNCKNRGLFKGQTMFAYYGDRVAESKNELESEGQKTVFNFINELNATAIAK